MFGDGMLSTPYQKLLCNVRHCGLGRALSSPILPSSLLFLSVLRLFLLRHLQDAFHPLTPDVHVAPAVLGCLLFKTHRTFTCKPLPSAGFHLWVFAADSAQMNLSSDLPWNQL